MFFREPRWGDERLSKCVDRRGWTGPPILIGEEERRGRHDVLLGFDTQLVVAGVLGDGFGPNALRPSSALLTL
jgi:hypothetical protein